MCRITVLALGYLCGASMMLAQVASETACRRSGSAAPAVGRYALVTGGGARGCVAPSGDSDGTILSCLRIGSVYVGQAKAEVERELGKPWRRLEPREGRSASAVYLVRSDRATGRGSYYVIEYETAGGEDIAFAVQFTGEVPGDATHAFSCLTLGDAEADVRRQLGSPSEITEFEFPAENVRGVVWWFDPDPVSIEIVAGVVYSIRVLRPQRVPPRRRRAPGTERR